MLNHDRLKFARNGQKFEGVYTEAKLYCDHLYFSFLFRKLKTTKFTTDNHVVLFTYSPITLQLRTKLRFDFQVFSYSDSSTD